MDRAHAARRGLPGGRAFPEASSEWEQAVKRRGEATDVFFADTSSLRYLPPVYYWLGRAQEAAGAAPAAKASYERFLSLRTQAETSDPLAADAQKRLKTFNGYCTVSVTAKLKPPDPCRTLTDTGPARRFAGTLT